MCFPFLTNLIWFLSRDRAVQVCIVHRARVNCQEMPRCCAVRAVSSARTRWRSVASSRHSL